MSTEMSRLEGSAPNIPGCIENTHWIPEIDRVAWDVPPGFDVLVLLNSTPFPTIFHDPN
jgi:hypothetical protein